MTLWAVATGVAQGWLDGAEFAPVVRAAWAGLQRAVNDDGTVSGICDGFGIHNSEADYKKCPTNYARSSPGLGAVLRAAIAMEVK
jgi:rhamnogalacturonyl hydrolase YesR